MPQRSTTIPLQIKVLVYIVDYMHARPYIPTTVYLPEHHVLYPQSQSTSTYKVNITKKREEEKSNTHALQLLAFPSFLSLSVCLSVRPQHVYYYTIYIVCTIHAPTLHNVTTTAHFRMHLSARDILHDRLLPPA